MCECVTVRCTSVFCVSSAAPIACPTQAPGSRWHAGTQLWVQEGQGGCEEGAVQVRGS